MAAVGTGSHKLDCKDLHGYLRSLSPAILDRLYDNPATCLAVFRELHPLSKHYVMRVIFVDQPISKSAISSWVSSPHQEDHNQASRVLSDLRIWHDRTLPGGLAGWILNPIFRNNLKTALLGGGKSWSSTEQLGSDKHAKDIQFLDSYAKERWECILHFLVDSRGVDGLSKDIATVVTSSGLMKMHENEPRPVITPAGFQFLLLDTPSQVWHFMLQYLETAQKRGLDVVTALSFLFQLSFSKLGKDYSTDSMTEPQLQLLQHLRELGLVFQRKRQVQRLFPTSLCLSKMGVQSSKQDGYIIVETNYRVNAYTNSDLEIEILGLFCEMLYRFPNLSVARLTRVSVQSAVDHGITAEQILHYLRTHAHPDMLSKTPVIPSVISDQIRLWELERDRINYADGVLYNQFLSNRDFELLRDYAKDLGVLVYENAVKRVIIVTPSGHDEVKRFWKRQRNQSNN
ncbi:general transcription factor IIH subunit 4-like [Anneissia japonica]|uniref:general transcription factor IIH subunit 4-like n=1 Tax=Anneissia japonica TaxID=1529436 RepID=UPI0014258747|nr:general transcription factor IIH subunit 4-like [Anneissia japonica]